MQPQLLKDVVGELIKKIKGDEREDIYCIWKEIVPLIAQKHSKLKEVHPVVDLPVKSARRTSSDSHLKSKQVNRTKSDKKRIELMVAVDSSPWLSNLNFSKQEWENKIEKALGDKFSVEIKFRIGTL